MFIINSILCQKKSGDGRKSGGKGMKLGRDKFDVILLCVVVVFAGIFLLLAARGYMKWWHSFNYLVLGAGVLTMLGELVRQAMPMYRRSEPEESILTLLVGLFAICIGASNLYGQGVEWVEWLSTLIIIVLAILMIVYSYRLRKCRKAK
jgi:peptidoglycan/LPS O-acetylase OafA/YrhL